MHIIVVGAGVTGIACAHNFLKRGHNVTLIEKASTPNQECSFGMAGFMGPISVQMLCAPFKGKAGLASIFAKTRRLGWDVSISQMKFLRALANARSADVWAANHESLMTLARSLKKRTTRKSISSSLLLMLRKQLRWLIRNSALLNPKLLMQ